MISIGEIIYRIQEQPMLRAVKTSDIVNHVKTVIELVGVPGLKQEKKINLIVQDYRAQLPSDFIKRVTARMIDSVSRTPVVVLTEGTDNFIRTVKDSSTLVKSDTLYSYKILDGYIYTDFKESEVELIYTAYYTDENGWPKIPNNASLLLAIENYIKQRHYGILADQNAQFERAYQRAEQQYLWYVAQATNSLSHLDPVEAQALGNAIIRMIPQKTSFYTDNKYIGQPEVLNKNIW
jgi:hypothetical protein